MLPMDLHDGFDTPGVGTGSNMGAPKNTLRDACLGDLILVGNEGGGGDYIAIYVCFDGTGRWHTSHMVVRFDGTIGSVGGDASWVISSCR